MIFYAMAGYQSDGPSAISRMGRVTSDVSSGAGVTKFNGVGHMAKFLLYGGHFVDGLGLNRLKREFP